MPRFGTAGCPLHYRVVVRNLSARIQNGLTLLENLADPRPSFEEWLAVQLAEQKLLRSFRFSARRPSNPFKLAMVKDADVPPVPPGQEVEVQVESCRCAAASCGSPASRWRALTRSDCSAR